MQTYNVVLTTTFYLLKVFFKFLRILLSKILFCIYSSNGSMLNSLMNGSSLSNGLAQGIAATLAASNGGHQQPQQTSVGNGLKEFLLEQHQLVRHLVLVNVVVVDTQWAKLWKKSVVISIKVFWREKILCFGSFKSIFL